MILHLYKIVSLSGKSCKSRMKVMINFAQLQERLGSISVFVLVCIPVVRYESLRWGHVQEVGSWTWVLSDNRSDKEFMAVLIHHRYVLWCPLYPIASLNCFMKSPPSKVGSKTTRGKMCSGFTFSELVACQRWTWGRRQAVGNEAVCLGGCSRKALI